MTADRVQIQRKGKCVSIWVRPALTEDGYGHTFDHDYQDDIVASVMADRLRHLLRDRTEMLVRAAYEEGWSDKSKKRKKSTAFTDNINNPCGGRLSW